MVTTSNLVLERMRIVFIFAVLISTFGIPAKAQPANGDWQMLFNGKDFTGWKQLNGKHTFAVRDGMIVGTTVPGEPNGFLCTEEEYGDFILELDVSIDTTMNNSGIQFRSLSHSGYQNGRVHGYQMEVDPKPQRWSGSIYDEARRGWLYTTELNLPGKLSFKNNSWNHYRIECFGTSNRTWVNGIPTAHLIDDETLKGFVGLQLHSNNPTDPIPPGNHQIRFRNIRIKTTNLKPSPPDDIFIVNLIPNNLSAEEKKKGYTLLWDGKTTQHWQGADQTRFPTVAWEVKNGMLTTFDVKAEAARSNVSAYTKRQYGAFELKFDFKLSEGADSGVKYLLTGINHVQADGENLEFQLRDDEKPLATGENANVHKLASLNGILEARHTPFSKRKIGVWNQAMIRVYPDGRIEHWLNGFRMLEFRGMLKAERMDKGFIALENKGYPVSFRSIKIREYK